MKEVKMLEEALLTAHVPEKVTLYLDFIKMFVKVLENPGSKKATKEISTRMLNVGLSMMILAPDSVTKAYIFWKALSANKCDPEKAIDAFGDIIMEMRKDLIGETVCTRDDAVGVFLRDQI
jgi:hypothetical protein